MKDYKKILEGVVNIINTTEKSDIGFSDICAFIGENCPELAESEDERIRRELIAHFRNNSVSESWSGLNVKKVLAWLEKQVEQKPKWTEADEAHLHSVTTHLEQWIECHPNTCGADIQGENLAWLESLKHRLQ